MPSVFRSSEIDGQFKLGGLFDWQVVRFGSLQNLVHIRCRAPEQVGPIWFISQARGLPVGLAIDKFGALLIADDVAMRYGASRTYFASMLRLTGDDSQGLGAALNESSELLVSPVRKLVRLADLVAVDEHALLFAK